MSNLKNRKYYVQFDINRDLILNLNIFGITFSFP